MPNLIDDTNINGNPAIVPITVSGSFDNQTIKVGKFPFNGTIKAVSFATSAALGSGVGIDVKNGSDVVVSCTDNLNGYELKISGLSNAAITSSSEISIVCDDFTGATVCTIIIYVQQNP